MVERNLAELTKPYNPTRSTISTSSTKETFSATGFEGFMRPFFAGILHTNSPKPTASNGPSQNFRVDGFTNFISNTCISPLFISRKVKAFAQKVHKGKVGDRLCPVCGRRWIVHRSSLGAGARRKVSAAQVPSLLHMWRAPQTGR